jgi:hypothetical protein
MKIKSQKIFGQNGDVREHLVNHFNNDGFIERTEYMNKEGEISFYSEFEYDKTGNRISKKEYNSNKEIQSSNLWEFDQMNREVRSIELTSENLIWEWHEKEFNENQIVYLAKDDKGKIIHKTIEDKDSGKEERFNEKGILYNIIIRDFDSNKRIVNEKHLDKRGKVKEEHTYKYLDNLEIWEYFEAGKLVKRERRQKDECQRTTFYLREDENGKSLEWIKWSYDGFGNPIEIENGIERDKPTHKSRIEIEYLKNDNGS